MYLNLARRSFKWPGVAGARVQTGSSPHTPPAGTGDCVLLNFATGLFALSDSSDRAPGQSREFLLQLDKMVSQHSGIGPDRTLRTLEIRGMAKNIKLGCEKILKAMRGPASCTFTGIQILRTDIGMHALFFHTGDSCLYEYDPLERTLSALALKNFWMIGKSARLYQTTEFSVKPNTIFILTTDGVAGGTDEPTQVRKFAEIIHCTEVEDIPDGIMHMGTPAGEFRDDAAVITLSTRSLQPATARIIMGGTTDLQEMEYKERCSSKFYRDSNVLLTEKSWWLDQVF